MSHKQPQTASAGAPARIVPLAVNTYVREHVAKEMAVVYERLHSAVGQVQVRATTVVHSKSAR